MRRPGCHYATEAVAITRQQPRISKGLGAVSQSGPPPPPAADYASVKLRVMAVSTGMPGPVVVEMTIFFR
jgi:hypothetical protein